MSSVSPSERMTVKKSILSHHHNHRRNKSGDLDVFEAARYFSAIAENQSTFISSGGGRISLDVPVRSLLTQETEPPSSTTVKHQQQVNKGKKKYSSGAGSGRQHPKPSSPGARLTTFLNSIFSQNAEKKKKKAKSVKDHEEVESPGGWGRSSCRRRPRSSLSHFRCSSTSDAIRDGDHDQIRDDRHNNAMDLSWLDEKLKLIESYNSEKQKRLDYRRKETVSVEIHHEEGTADESDCSSDLFELENCDLGLPVYETTNMDNIKRSGKSIAAPAAAPPR